MFKLLAKICLFLTITVSIILFSPDSNAQVPTGGVNVWPNVIELDFSNNKSKFASRSVYVENKSNSTKRIRAYSQGWNMDEFGIQTYLEEPDDRTLPVMFNPKEFNLPAGEKQRVRISAKLPEGVDGEFRGIIFFETIIPKKEVLDTSKENLSVTLSFVTRYGVTVYGYKGEKSRNLEFKNLKAELIDSKQYLVATIKNEGNIHNYVYGELTLNNTDNSETQTIKLKKYTVLPEKTQKMLIKIPDKKLKRGNYNAHLKLTYNTIDDKEQLFEATTKFKLKESGNDSTKDDLQKLMIEDEVKLTPENLAVPENIKN